MIPCVPGDKAEVAGDSSLAREIPWGPVTSEWKFEEWGWFGYRNLGVNAFQEEETADSARGDNRLISWSVFHCEVQWFPLSDPCSPLDVTQGYALLCAGLTLVKAHAVLSWLKCTEEFVPTIPGLTHTCFSLLSIGESSADLQKSKKILLLQLHCRSWHLGFPWTPPIARKMYPI